MSISEDWTWSVIRIYALLRLHMEKLVPEIRLALVEWGIEDWEILSGYGNQVVLLMLNEFDRLSNSQTMAVSLAVEELINDDDKETLDRLLEDASLRPIWEGIWGASEKFPSFAVRVAEKLAE